MLTAASQAAEDALRQLDWAIGYIPAADSLVRDHPRRQAKVTSPAPNPATRGSPMS